MTSMKTKAEGKRHRRDLAEDPNRSRPLSDPRSDPAIHIMSSGRRESPPHRVSRPFSPPRAPRPEYQDSDGNFYFNSDRARPQRDRYRERSRSRSPDSDRRRPSERHDSYNPRGETDRRPSENYYRPIYNDTQTRPSPRTDARRTSGINTSGHSSPISKAAPLSKTSIPPRAQEERESIEEAQAHRSTNRAINAPVPFPPPAARMPAPVGEESNAGDPKVLGEVLKKVIDVAVTKSALQSQQFTAEKRAQRRTAEFEKSKPHHEKFPSIKESQTASKTDAERELRIITEKVEEENSLLNSLAIQAAEQIIPALSRGRGNSAEHENLQQRYESLEKTCKGFEKLFDKLTTRLDESRKANQALEEKHSALEKDFRSVLGQLKEGQSRIDSDRHKVQQVLEKVEKSEQAIESLRSDLFTTKADAAKSVANSTQISALKTQVLKIEAQAARGKDVDSLRTELKTLEDTTSKAAKTSEGQLRTLSESLVKVDKVKANSDALLSRMTDLAVDQTKFREAYNQLTGRVTEIASRPDPTAFQERLERLEKSFSRELTELALRKELDALSDHMKQRERTSPTASLNPSIPNPKTLESRVDMLEKGMKPVSASLNKVDTLEKNGIFKLKASEVVLRNDLEAIAKQVKRVESKATALEAARITGIDAKLEQRLQGLEANASTFADFKRRIDTVEEHQRSASSGAGLAPAPFPNSKASPDPSSAIHPRIDEISSRIQNLEKQVDDIRESQKVFDEGWTEIVNESIIEESQKLQTRIASLEGKSSELNSSLEKLRDVGFGESKNSKLDDTITSKLVDIVKNQPTLLPFPTIEQVNNALAPFRGLVQMGAQMQRLHESNEATILSLGNLEHRVNNINTLELANHIMGQLFALHPEAAMNELKSDLKGLNMRLTELINTVDNLKGSTQSLEARVQNQDTAEAMRQQYQDLRKEMDSLAEYGNNLGQRVKDTEKNLKDLSANYEKASKGLEDLQKENEDIKQTVTDQISTFHGDMEQHLEKMKEATSRVQRPKATSPAVSHTSNRSNQNSVSRGPRPNFATANKQPSAASDKSNKRKLDNGISAKTNGVGRPSSSSGSPQRKRHRRHVGDDDPEDDPDYSEEIPQPGVSSDEDSKPPRKPSGVIDLSGLADSD